MAKPNDLVGYLGKGPGVPEARGTSKSFSGKNAPKEMTPAEEARWGKGGVAREAHANTKAHASSVEKGANSGNGSHYNPDQARDDHGRWD